MTKTVFLPGSGGSRSFWEPACAHLALGDDEVRLGWPGFDDEPIDPNVHDLSDLARFVLDRIEDQFNLVAQSMGGVVALQVALAAPEQVRRLVLCATSGGVDFGDIDVEDWRPAYLREMPESTPRWFVDDRTDVAGRLGEIATPALLIWGGEDRIVPPAAGRLLAGLLPDARIVVISGAGHDVAVTHAAEVAAHIRAFLMEHTLTPGLSLEGEGGGLDTGRAERRESDTKGRGSA